MLQKEIITKEKKSVYSSNVSIPDFRSNVKQQQSVSFGENISKYSNDIIFIGFAAVAIYTFYNVLMSLFM